VASVERIAPSTRKSTRATPLVSLAEATKDVTPATVCPVGASIETVGEPVSIANDRVASVRSGSPPAPSARTAKECPPSASAE